jgi:cytochrome P450
MTARAAETTAAWRDGQTLDARAEMAAPSMRTAVATMVSGESFVSGSAPLRRAVNDLAVVLRGSLRQGLLPPVLSGLPTIGTCRYRRATHRLRRLLGGIVAERRTSSADHSDLLAALLGGSLPDRREPAGEDRRLTDTEILDQVIAFFGAGTETVATTLTWALHLLAGHPNAERRLHQEVDEVLAGSPATGEHVPRLEFTRRVAYETLRLYPPGWVNVRTASVNTDLGGHPVPAGTTVVYSPYLSHRRPDLYDDPQRFDPDRWDTTGRTPPGRAGFIPFGAGPRKCIGDQFALTEVVITLATIATQWRLLALPGEHVQPTAGITLHPRTLRMRAAKRIAA